MNSHQGALFHGLLEESSLDWQDFQTFPHVSLILSDKLYLNLERYRGRYDLREEEVIVIMRVILDKGLYPTEKIIQLGFGGIHVGLKREAIDPPIRLTQIDDTLSIHEIVGVVKLLPIGPFKDHVH